MPGNWKCQAPNVNKSDESDCRKTAFGAWEFMGLQFRVGPVEFASPYQEQVEAALKNAFGYDAPARSVASDTSDELGWSGWGALQETVANTIGAENALHLLSMEAWMGVYLPLSIEPRVLQIGDAPTPLSCARKAALSDELKRFAAMHSLPTQDEQLNGLWDEFMESDEDEDEAQDIQTYIQLMLAAQRALSRNLTLWVVK